MAAIVVLFHSGYGHTRKQAESVLAGVTETPGTSASLIAIDAEGQVTEADWASLAAADAIIFGSPTYMGGPSWQFKRFADASSKPWFGQVWKDVTAQVGAASAFDGPRASVSQGVDGIARPFCCIGYPG